MCRSRRELSNEYLLAKIGVDTAENEPLQVCPLSAYRSPRYHGAGETNGICLSPDAGGSLARKNGPPSVSRLYSKGASPLDSIVQKVLCFLPPLSPPPDPRDQLTHTNTHLSSCSSFSSLSCLFSRHSSFLARRSFESKSMEWTKRKQG